MTTYDPHTQRVDKVIRGFGQDPLEVRHVWRNGLLAETIHANPENPGSFVTYGRTYDQAGRLELFRPPTPAQGKPTAPTCFKYTDFGELKFEIQGPKVTQHAYDDMGNPTWTTWTGEYKVSLEREPNGLGLLKSAKHGGLKKSFEYDLWKGTPSSDTQFVGAQVLAQHTHFTDKAGNYVGFLDSLAKSHEWPVDENNRPTSRVYSGVLEAELQYTVGGLLDKEILHGPSGSPIATTVYVYDDVGRLKSKTTHREHSSELLARYEWDYWPTGEVKQIRQEPRGATISYEYTSRGELWKETIDGNNDGSLPPPFSNSIGSAPDGNSSADPAGSQNAGRPQLAIGPRVAVYTYDAAGNRKTRTLNGILTTYSYNALSQLLRESTIAHSREVAHEYDDKGNECRRLTTVNGETTEEVYDYNHLNLLSYYRKSGRASAEWHYDYWPTGERYAKTNVLNGRKEIFVHRMDDVVTEFVQASGGGDLSGRQTYIQGPGIDSKSTRVSEDGTTHTFLGDQVGTLGTTIDHAGQIVDQIQKDAFGVALTDGGAERFSGLAQRESDKESGLVYMRHRMYDPSTGRFTQTDPLHYNRAIQHYSYGRNNPNLYTDPEGLEIVIRGDHKFAKKVRDALQQLIGDKATLGLTQLEPYGDTPQQCIYKWKLQLWGVNDASSSGSQTALELLQHLISEKRIVNIYEASNVADSRAGANGRWLLEGGFHSGAFLKQDSSGKLVPGEGIDVVDVFWSDSYDPQNRMMGVEEDSTGKPVFAPHTRTEIVLAHELIHASLMMAGRVDAGGKPPKTASDFTDTHREWGEGQVIENRPLKGYPKKFTPKDVLDSAGFMGPDQSVGGFPWTENKIRKELGLTKRVHHAGVPESALTK